MLFAQAIKTCILGLSCSFAHVGLVGGTSATFALLSVETSTITVSMALAP